MPGGVEVCRCYLLVSLADASARRAYRIVGGKIGVTRESPRSVEPEVNVKPHGFGGAERFEFSERRVVVNLVPKLG